MVTIDDVVDRALVYQGAPYTWRGKGVYLWSPSGLVLHAFGEPVFDCSGLVTVALRDAGGPDWRATRNAESMRQAFPSCDPWEFGALRLYGTPAKATHVAFALHRGLVLEAAGGDSTTTSPTEARRRRHAAVRVNRDRRPDFLGAVRLVVP